MQVVLVPPSEAEVVEVSQSSEDVDKVCFVFESVYLHNIGILPVPKEMGCQL